MLGIVEAEILFTDVKAVSSNGDVSCECIEVSRCLCCLCLAFLIALLGYR